MTLLLHIIAVDTGESNQAAAALVRSAKSAETSNEHKIRNPWVCITHKLTLLVGFGTGLCEVMCIHLAIQLLRMSLRR